MTATPLLLWASIASALAGGDLVDLASSAELGAAFDALGDRRRLIVVVSPT